MTIKELKTSTSLNVYIVTAFRWGDLNNHNYIVGVYSDIEDAKRVADAEAIYRGGKYECVVDEVPFNQYSNNLYQKRVYDTFPKKVKGEA